MARPPVISAALHLPLAGWERKPRLFASPAFNQPVFGAAVLPVPRGASVFGERAPTAGRREVVSFAAGPGTWPRVGDSGCWPQGSVQSPVLQGSTDRCTLRVPASPARVRRVLRVGTERTPVGGRPSVSAAYGKVPPSRRSRQPRPGQDNEHASCWVSSGPRAPAPGPRVRGRRPRKA